MLAGGGVGWVVDAGRVVRDRRVREWLAATLRRRLGTHLPRCARQHLSSLLAPGTRLRWAYLAAQLAPSGSEVLIYAGDWNPAVPQTQPL